MKIIESLLKIQEEIGHIGKDQKNKFQNYNFRGIDQVYNELHRLFVKSEVLTFPRIVKSEFVAHKTTNAEGDEKTSFKLYCVVEYTFVGKDGSEFKMSMAGEGADSSDKTTGKALSNAHKYALFQMFMIPTEENLDSDQSQDTDFTKTKKPKDARNFQDEKHRIGEILNKNTHAFTEQELGDSRKYLLLTVKTLEKLDIFEKRLNEKIKKWEASQPIAVRMEEEPVQKEFPIV